MKKKKKKTTKVLNSQQKGTTAMVDPKRNTMPLRMIQQFKFGLN